MTQQLVLVPLGIITEPNKLGGIPAGALLSMTDCVERAPGVIENIKAWQTRISITGQTGNTAMFVIVPPDSPRVLILQNSASGWHYRWYDVAAGTALFTLQPLSIFIGGNQYTQSVQVATQPKLSYAVVGNQLFVNFYSTVLVWDTTNPQNSTEAAPRPAGLQPPGFEVSLALGVGTALPPKQWAAYTVVLKRPYGRDKVAISAPAVAAYADTHAHSDIKNVAVTVRLISGLHVAGDIIEVYRTPCKPVGAVTGTALAYQTGEEVGPEYRRSLSHTLTAAEAALSTLVLTDRTVESALTEALYTNQAQDSFAASAEPPPAVEALIPHKGHLFGFGPTFPAQLKLAPTGSWGGIDASSTDAQATASFMQVNLTGCTWSNGGTTVTVSPTSQLARVFVGQQVSGVGSAAQVQSVGASTFTLSVPASNAGSSTTLSLFDIFEYAAMGGSLNGAFLSNWPLFQGSFANDQRVRLIGPALKLPPYTPANIFIAQPVDGFAIIARFADDARNPLVLRSVKGSNWNPEVATFFNTATSIYPQYQPNAVVWSELNEPEGWPVLNKDFFTNGAFCVGAATRDAIFVHFTDALMRISGSGGVAGKGYDWRADPVLTGITAQGSQTMCSLLDTVYSATSEGLVKLDSGGQLTNITKGRVHDQLATPPWSNGPYNTSTAAFVCADEENGEILYREPSAPNGRMWIYNPTTDRLSQTISHPSPFHAGYSRYFRSLVVIGNESGLSWTVKTQTGAYGNFNYTYQTVYGDNPFALRQWQTLNVTAETAGATVQPTFNATVGNSRALDADGRAGFEVPRNAPAVGNTLQVKVDVVTANRTKVTGIALDYRDHTDRRKNR
jgi:hypothetical protein